MTAFGRSTGIYPGRSNKQGLEEAVGSRARRQHGLLTREQALAAGLSVDQIEHRLESGRWLVVRPGVYLINGTPPSFEQSVLAACLAAGEDIVASHATAALLWGLAATFEPDGIHVTGPLPRLCRLDGVIGHRSGKLDPADAGRRAGIPVTSVARTIIDVAGSLPPHRLGPVVDDALRRRILMLPQLRSTAERLRPAPGRSMKAIKAVLEQRLPGFDPGDSDREVWLVEALVGGGFERPTLGHRVRIGHRTYKLDVSYPEQLVAFEYDGWEWHKERTSFDHDRARTRELELAGWMVLRYTSASTPADVIRDAERAGIPRPFARSTRL